MAAGFDALAALAGSSTLSRTPPTFLPPIMTLGSTNSPMLAPIHFPGTRPSSLTSSSLFVLFSANGLSRASK